MAKTLGVRVSAAAGIANPAALDEGVLSPVTPTGSLGSIVLSILSAASVAMVCVVDLGNRIVHARPTSGADTVDLMGGAGGTLIGSLKQLEEGRSAVFIDEGNAVPDVTVEENGASALEVVANKPSLVARTVSSLISAIEDAIADEADILGLAAVTPFIVVDQTTELVSVVSAIPANVAAVRALFNDGGTLEDQARYEQIPAEEAAAAEGQAFE